MFEMLLFASSGKRAWLDVVITEEVSVAIDGDGTARVIGGDSSKVPGLNGSKGIDRLFGGNYGSFLIQYKNGTHAFCGYRKTSNRVSYDSPTLVDIGGKVRDAAFSEYHIIVAREDGVFRQVYDGYGTDAPKASDSPPGNIDNFTGVACSNNSNGYTRGSRPGTYGYNVYGGNNYYGDHRNGNGVHQILCDGSNSYMVLYNGSLNAWGRSASFIDNRPRGIDIAYATNNKRFGVAITTDGTPVLWSGMTLPLPSKIIDPTRVSVMRNGLAVIDKKGDLLIYTNDASIWSSAYREYLVTA